MRGLLVTLELLLIAAAIGVPSFLAIRWAGRRFLGWHKQHELGQARWEINVRSPAAGEPLRPGDTIVEIMRGNNERATISTISVNDPNFDSKLLDAEQLATERASLLNSTIRRKR